MLGALTNRPDSSGKRSHWALLLCQQRSKRPIPSCLGNRARFKVELASLFAGILSMGTRRDGDGWESENWNYYSFLRLLVPQNRLCKRGLASMHR